MKKILIALAILIGVILLALVTLPFLFKEKIKALALEQANKNLNATVYFEDVGLSFIKNFPNACVSLENFGVVNKAPFEGDTLVSGESFELVVDLMSIFKGDEIRLNKVYLKKPRIRAMVLKDGSANWDIALPDSAADADTGATAAFVINLQGYEIEQGYVYYHDATLPMSAEIRELNHSGTGDFTADDFDLRTQTQTGAVSVVFDGITYLNNAKIAGDIDLNINTLTDLSVRILKGDIQLNDLKLGAEGTVAMPGDDINLDLTYAAKDASFKSILSLVPGVYTQDFNNIKTDGTLSLAGFVKGTYNETKLPGFGFDLDVANAMLQYPDLPTPVTGINISMKLNEPDGTFNNLLVDVQKFHADLGNNPIDGKVRVQGLEKMQIRGDINARLNLEELTTMFPMEGTQLKGLFEVKGIADGVYDEKAGKFPEVDATMSLTDGYVKNAEYPAELTDMRFRATLGGVDQDLKKAVLDVPTFHFAMDGEPVDGRLHVEDFDDPRYELAASGVLDLEKLTKIYPLDSMSLAGKIIVQEFSTKGRMSDIEAERYTELPTSGKVQVQNLRYSDYELAHPVTVESGTATFTPQRLEITDAKGMLGSSDYQVDGYFTNYMGYALLENQPLKGQMKLTSNKLDLNEWMSEEEAPVEPGSEASPYEAYPVPENLDITFQADLKEVQYTNLTLNNLVGNLIVADQAVKMDGVGFKTLGAQVNLDGSYNTKDPKKPAYSLFTSVEQLNIQKAYAAFSSIRAFVPITQLIDGIANTSFGITGLLQQDLMPILESITSEGAFMVTEGKVAGLPVMDKVASLTKIDALKALDLAGAKGWFTIQNGYLEVKPFDIKVQDMVLTLGGKQSISGAMDYDLDLDMPTGALGQSALGALSNLTGGTVKTQDRIQVGFKVGGTYTDPKVSALQSQTANQVTSELTNAAEQKLKEQTGVDIKLNEDSLKQEASKLQQQALDSAKTAAKIAQKQAEDSVKAALEIEKKKAQEALEKELENQVGKDAKDKLDELKNKFKLPGKKK